ncbi:MAG: PqqD family protein [Betaproteobacteria bacterium]|nr:PqqD family protein [Betaproteobacteria bacterium]
MGTVESNEAEANMNDRARIFPDPETVARLALSDSGFVFDPLSGRSYSVNATGLAVLRLLQQPTGLAKVVEALELQFEGDAATLERDVIEFAGVLRSQIK